VIVLSAFNYAMSQIHGLSGNDAADDADPDQDGWTNAMEYAFGMDPVIAGGHPTETWIDGNELVIAFLMRADVTYIVKHSANLVTWSESDVAPTPAADQPSGIPAGYVRSEARVPITDDRGFLRVDASVP
jgi:hypothetical protein